jgi:hypothetical protein
MKVICIKDFSGIKKGDVLEVEADRHGEVILGLDGEWVCDLESDIGIERFEEYKQEEMVERPKHYNMGNFEVIDVIHDWDLNFNLGNAIKYIARAEHKGNKIQDLEKALFYLKDEIERLTNG